MSHNEPTGYAHDPYAPGARPVPPPGYGHLGPAPGPAPYAPPQGYQQASPYGPQQGYQSPYGPPVPGQVVLQPVYVGVPAKSWTVALVLCLLLGVFGAHRFYTGHVGLGVLYLFTGGLFGIGALVDLILIIVDNYRDSHGRPLQH
ncbi:TM2 domain-containing protein [Granulicoccus phenolivorans]|uniref:TM2 domain-containing protein n=1 Tax=Granulicoccus phenolivorans TaxID=266854 RepID=UPI0004284E48|nr:TM2 domain-containing protein [Granulicoccus phenolivorans]